jgi:hypothetical protein
MIDQIRLEKGTGKLAALAVLVLCFLLSGLGNLWAANYTITGQVFRVTSEELAIKQKAADDAGVPLDVTTLTKGIFPLNHIKIYKKGTSEILGEGYSGRNGQFKIVISIPLGPPGPDVELRVFKVADGGSLYQPPVNDEVNTFSAIGLWTTNIKLLVINDDILDYRHDAASPAAGLVFTRIGLVPVPYIEQVTAATRGMALIPNDPSVPAYVPAKFKQMELPFGGALRIFGSFGEPKAGCAGTQVDYYQVTITNLDTAHAFTFKDPLSKIKSVISTTSPLTITNITEQLGPFTGTEGISNVEGLYRVNQDTADTIYIFPDLRMYWNTSGQNGLYEISVKYYRKTGGSLTAPVVQEMTTPACFDPVAPGTPIGKLIVRINNQPLDVKYRGIWLKDGSNYYMVGGVKYDFNDEGLCSIMNLKQPPRQYGIEIDYTAHHPGNYMWKYSLTATANDPSIPGVTFVNEVYTPTSPPTSTSVLWEGTPAAGDTKFKDYFNWPNACAYIFDLVAWSRVQDGYDYIHHVHQRRTYYVNPN